MSHVGDPSLFAETVTPSDTVSLSAPTRALYIGVTGNISVQMYGNGATQIFSNVPVGILPVQVTRVNATGTTASSIVAMR
jgi:hypothetical protein